jgi:toxin CptA
VGLLTGLALYAVSLSELPRPLTWLATAWALLHGGRCLWREWRRPAHSLVISRDPASPSWLDGVAVDNIRVQWRGPLAFVQVRCRDGRRHRLSGWPDNLPAARRRELRLAVGAHNASRRRRRMAL